MNPNNKKKTPPRGGKGGSNWRGLLSMLCWAVLLTTILGYAGNYMTSAGHQASNVEVEYSEFRDMVKAQQVSGVDFDTEEAILLITPADGYVYTNDEGVIYTKSTDEDGSSVYTYLDKNGKEQQARLQLFTVQIESNDATIASKSLFRFSTACIFSSSFCSADSSASGSTSTGAFRSIFARA